MLFLSLFVLFACSEQGNNQPVAGKKKAVLKAKDLPPASKKEEFDILRFLVLEESKNGKEAKVDSKNTTLCFLFSGENDSMFFRRRFLLCENAL